MPRIETNTFTGTASYATGGFTINTGLTTVDFAAVDILVAGANLAHVHFEYSRSGANVTVKIVRYRFDKADANTGSVTDLPSGVSAATVSGQTYDTVSHNHTMDHNHAAVTSSTRNGAAGGGSGRCSPA